MDLDVVLWVNTPSPQPINGQRLNFKTAYLEHPHLSRITIKPEASIAWTQPLLKFYKVLNGLPELIPGPKIFYFMGPDGYHVQTVNFTPWVTVGMEGECNRHFQIILDARGPRPDMQRYPQVYIDQEVMLGL